MSCRDFEKFSKIQHFWKRNTSAYFCIPLMCHIIHIMSSCFSDNIKQNPRKTEASIMPCILCNNDSLHFYSTFIFCTVDFVWFSLFLSCSTFWLLQNQKRMHFLWPDPSTMFFHIRPEYPHKRAFHPYYKYMFLLFEMSLFQLRFLPFLFLSPKLSILTLSYIHLFQNHFDANGQTST